MYRGLIEVVLEPTPRSSHSETTANRNRLAELRRSRSDAMDRLIGELFAGALSGTANGGGERLSVVAVGGYGRRELSPYSDIDLVLVHDPSVSAKRVAAIADALWYPLWDRGIPLDHAVRDSAQMRAIADHDLRATLGMLDARHVAGDPDLTGRLRTGVLERWRRRARTRLPELAEYTRKRPVRYGELAYAAAPDLKESAGGLRDGVALRALVATWLVDIPHEESETYRTGLLDIRDVLHEASGRRTDRLVPELVDDVAAVRGVEPAQLMFELRDLGRRTSHLTRAAWRRIEQVSAPPLGTARRVGLRRPSLDVLAKGVAQAGGEIVLTADADPACDPLLALRAAAFAAERGLLLAPSSATRLRRDAAALGSPWPGAARQLFVRLLSAGPGLPPVWQELDQAGMVDDWLPEWAHIRLRSSTALVHNFTIDRHSVEACVQTAELVRSVRRPDLLVTAALLHDIGKGRTVDHSERGGPMAYEIARRWGFPAPDAGAVSRLVRHHLLLPTIATRRDLFDPDTAAGVAAELHDVDELDLLVALTEADAKATSAAAWSPWRSRLIRDLIRQVHALLIDRPAPPPAPESHLDDPVHPGQVVGLRLEPDPDGRVVTISAPDRAGLLADAAGVLAVSGLSIRSARVGRVRGRAVMRWDVTNHEVDDVRLRHRLERLLRNPMALGDRLTGSPGRTDLPAHVRFVADASESASVLEVRAADHRGLVSTICRAIADAGVHVRTAHIETLGHQAVDVFYLVDQGGGLLSAELEGIVETNVRSALDN
jgi:[protein-PII] uridylyltransferase